jgi:hypothetical protein
LCRFSASFDSISSVLGGAGGFQINAASGPLDAVMAIWSSAASFSARIATLTSSGGLLQAGVAVFDDGGGPVARAIVDRHDPEVGQVLGEERAHRPLDAEGLVAAGDHHRDGGGGPGGDRGD